MPRNRRRTLTRGQSKRYQILTEEQLREWGQELELPPEVQALQVTRQQDRTQEFHQDRN